MDTSTQTLSTLLPAQQGTDALWVPPVLNLSELQKNPRSYVNLPVITAGTEALVAASAEVLSLVARLKMTEQYPAPDLLQKHLMEVLSAFVREAALVGCSDEHIGMAHYLLLRTCDEVLEATPWGLSVWPAYRLLTRFYRTHHHDPYLPQLISYLQQQPHTHEPVLMVLHRCLALGLGQHLEVGLETASPRLMWMDAVYQQLVWLEAEATQTPWTWLAPVPKKRWRAGMGTALLGIVLLCFGLFRLSVSCWQKERDLSEQAAHLKARVVGRGFDDVAKEWIPRTSRGRGTTGDGIP